MSMIQGCLVSLCPGCRGRDKGIVNRALSFKGSDLAKFFFKFLSLTWRSHLGALVWAVSSILQSLPYPPRSCLPIPSHSFLVGKTKHSLVFSYVSAVITMQCINCFPTWLLWAGNSLSVWIVSHSFLYVLSTHGMHITGILTLVINESKALALGSSQHPHFHSPQVTAIHE